MAARNNGSRLAWGIILIAIALLIFLDNMDVSVWGAVARLWPVILILWGAWKLYHGMKEHREEQERRQEQG